MWGLLVSIAAWLFGRTVVTISYGPARSPFSSIVVPWFHWDTLNYLRVALVGRTFSECPGVPHAVHAAPAWCGLAAWLPAYPFAAAQLSRLGIPLEISMALVSQLFWLVALFLVWLGWARRLSRPRAAAVLALASVAPGAVYALAMFPLSMALALLLAALIAFQRGRLWTMALLLFVANLTYPAAWYATVAVVVAAAILGLRSSRRAALRDGLIAASALSAIAVLMLHDQIAFHQPRAFFILQAAGREGPKYLVGIPRSLSDSLGPTGTHLLVLQAVFITALCTWALVIVALRRRRSGLFDGDLMLALIGLAVVVGNALSTTAGDWSRSVLLALPALLVLRRVGRIQLCLLLGASALLCAAMSHFFFTNQLI